MLALIDYTKLSIDLFFMLRTALLICLIVSFIHMLNAVKTIDKLTKSLDIIKKINKKNKKVIVTFKATPLIESFFKNNSKNNFTHSHKIIINIDKKTFINKKYLLPYLILNKNLTEQLIESTFTTAIRLNEKTSPDKKHREEVASISSIVLDKKIKSSFKIKLALLLMTLIGFFIASLNSRLYFFIAPLLCLILIQIDQKILSFRIKKGWFGRNNYELTEILDFIEKENNKNNTHDCSGKERPLYSKEREDPFIFNNNFKKKLEQEMEGI